MQLQDRAEDSANGSVPSQPTPASEQAPGAQRHRTLHRIGMSYGRLIYRLRWVVLAIWVVGLAASIPFAVQVGSALKGSGYSFSGSESVKVSAILTNTLNQPKTTMVVVFQSANTNVSDAAYQTEVQNFINKAKVYPHVTSVIPGGVGQDSKTTYVAVNFDQVPSSESKFVDDFNKIVPSGASATPARAYLTGEAPVSAAFNQISQKDTEQAELKGLPIALAVLLIVFGTVIAGLLPLILAAFAVPVSLAIIFGIATHVSTSVFVLNIASIIGLGISIDYSLFMVRRFREELARGRSVQDAIGWTVGTAGEAILFSGLTVMIGFIGLMLIGIQFMTSFGIGGAVTVAVSALAALTLLPAVLGILGAKVNALRVPVLWRLAGVGEARVAQEADSEPMHEPPAGFWRKLALGVMAHPVITLVMVVGLLVAMGWPLLSINLGTPSITGLPKTAPSRAGNDILMAQFPEMSGNTIVVVAQTTDGSSILTSANVANVDQLTQWLNAQSDVSGVTSLTQFPGDSTSTAPTWRSSSSSTAQAPMPRRQGWRNWSPRRPATIRPQSPSRPTRRWIARRARRWLTDCARATTRMRAVCG